MRAAHVAFVLLLQPQASRIGTFPRRHEKSEHIADEPILAAS
jgi:hypothetical protein